MRKRRYLTGLQKNGKMCVSCRELVILQSLRNEYFFSLRCLVAVKYQLPDRNLHDSADKGVALFCLFAIAVFLPAFYAGDIGWFLYCNDVPAPLQCQESLPGARSPSSSHGYRLGLVSVSFRDAFDKILQ